MKISLLCIITVSLTLVFLANAQEDQSGPPPATAAKPGNSDKSIKETQDEPKKKKKKNHGSSSSESMESGSDSGSMSNEKLFKKKRKFKKVSLPKNSDNSVAKGADELKFNNWIKTKTYEHVILKLTEALEDMFDFKNADVLPFFKFFISVDGGARKLKLTDISEGFGFDYSNYRRNKFNFNMRFKDISARGKITFKPTIFFFSFKKSINCEIKFKDNLITGRGQFKTYDNDEYLLKSLNFSIETQEISVKYKDFYAKGPFKYLINKVKNNFWMELFKGYF